MGQDEIKIRVVPRSNDKSKKAAAQEARDGKSSRWIMFTGFALAGAFWFLGSILILNHKQEEQSTHRSISSESAKRDHLPDFQTDIGSSIHRYMTDTMARQDMMKMRLEMENAEISDRLEDETKLANNERAPDTVATALPPSNAIDLTTSAYSSRTPEEKINSRLAVRKWLNEQERAERINFVRNFIRSAYDRGYEVQLNQDLVVIGVKKIQKNRTVTIDQILDRMAKQGF